MQMAELTSPPDASTVRTAVLPHLSHKVQLHLLHSFECGLQLPVTLQVYPPSRVIPCKPSAVYILHGRLALLHIFKFGHQLYQLASCNQRLLTTLTMKLAQQQLPPLDFIKNAVLRDKAGQEVHASELWREQPMVIYLVRRPGCGEYELLTRVHENICFVWPMRAHS